MKQQNEYASAEERRSRTALHSAVGVVMVVKRDEEDAEPRLVRALKEDAVGVSDAPVDLFKDGRMWERVAALESRYPRFWYWRVQAPSGPVEPPSISRDGLLQLIREQFPNPEGRIYYWDVMGDSHAPTETRAQAMSRLFERQSGRTAFYSGYGDFPVAVVRPGKPYWCIDLDWARDLIADLTEVVAFLYNKHHDRDPERYRRVGTGRIQASHKRPTRRQVERHRKGKEIVGGGLDADHVNDPYEEDDDEPAQKSQAAPPAEGGVPEGGPASGLHAEPDQPGPGASAGGAG